MIRDIPTYDGWLEDGKHCLKGEDSNDFAELLDKLREDDNLRDKLSENAKKMAENHSLDKIGKKLHQTYRKLNREEE